MNLDQLKVFSLIHFDMCVLYSIFFTKFNVKKKCFLTWSWHWFELIYIQFFFSILNYSIKLTNYNLEPDIKFIYKWTWIFYGHQLWRLIRRKKKFNYLVRIHFYHWLCNTPFLALYKWHCISCITAAISKHSVSILYKVPT